MDAYAFVETFWGVVVLAARNARLAAVILPSPARATTRRLVKRKWPDARERPNLLADLQRRIQRYFDGRREAFDVPIDLTGRTPFQRRILEACRRIPYGATMTYGQLAADAGTPAAARAAGGVMAANPIPLVIPCHRVIRAGGALGGFSAEGGLELKSKLLELEAHACLHARRSAPHIRN